MTVERVPSPTELGIDRARYRADPDYRARVNESAEQADAIAVHRARRNVNACIEYVYGVTQEPFHKKLNWIFDTYPRAIVDAPIEHGKTFQVGTGRTTFQLGTNHSEAIAHLSNTREVPEQSFEIFIAHLENNERLHKVFPTLRIEKQGRTATGNRYLTVERPRGVIKDESLVTASFAGTIRGKRWTRLKTDDMLDLDAAWTDESRKKATTRFDGEMLGRLSAEGTHEDIGTPIHVEDTRHIVRARPGYFYARFDATTGLMHDINDAVVERIAEDVLWPRYWRDPASGRLFGYPRERIEMVRRTMDEVEFARQFRCIALAGVLEIFKRHHLEYAKTLGHDLGLFANTMPALPGEVCYTGVDLAVGKKSTNDKTAMHTGTHREGRHGLTKATLDMRAGRWEIHEILRNMLDVLRIYPNHGGFRVENNAAQDYLIQVTQQHDMIRAVGFTDTDLSRLRVTPHTTTSTYKYDPMVGIRGMAIEFENKRWALPCQPDMMSTPETAELISGLVAFDPAAHTRDEVMAAWLFIEQCRQYGPATGGSWSEYGIA